MAVAICLGLIGLVFEVPLLLRIRRNRWGLLAWIPLSTVPPIIFVLLFFPSWWLAYSEWPNRNSDLGIIGVILIFLINSIATMGSALLICWLAALILYPFRVAWNVKGAVAGILLSAAILAGWYLLAVCALPTARHG